MHVNDDQEKVLNNRKKFFEAFGFSLADGVALNQVHGNHVLVVDDNAKGRGTLNHSHALGNADGMITNRPGILLTTYYADCVPIYVVDPITNSIGLAHAGWKGTVLKIGKSVIEKMQSVYGTKPADCICVIGPSIGPCCYQVDGNVIEPIKEHFGENQQWVLSKVTKTHANLNLWEANKISLLEAGLSHENIYLSGLCTSCNEKYFFSHRRDNGKTGRMSAVIAIKG